MSRTKERVAEAVNYLIQAPNYSRLVGEITNIIDTWDTHPMAYDGHLSSLNSLIDVGLQNREAYRRLLRLVENKRKEIPEAKRIDYQRILMQERRQRVYKALDLHELRVGPLSGQARKDEAVRIQARWKEAKAKYLAERGELSWKERNAATQEFWGTIDATLDRNLADAKRGRT